MIVPPVIEANVPVVPTSQGACTAKPCATSSTYCLVAASVDAVGVATATILDEFTSTDPVPVVCNEIG